MRIPQFWAEGRAHQPRVGRNGKQVTVRRWGWSDESQENAQRHADERVQEAFTRVLAGENPPRREPKVPYNGAEGVPIREEIFSRHGETIVTRNSYGALCLNTPGVLFADVDFGSTRKVSTGCIGAVLGGASLGTAALIYIPQPSLGWFGAVMASLMLLTSFFLGAEIAHRALAAWRWFRGGAETIARRRVQAFVERNPAWAVRVYRTPLGLRLLATHAVFDPNGPGTIGFFNAVGADPVYVTMCRRQKCFRARVSPKPWRVGVDEHLKPRPGTWPIKPERMPDRQSWIEAYEGASEGYASCRCVETLGSGVVDPAVLEVQRLHDRLCSAESDLPIA